MTWIPSLRRLAVLGFLVASAMSVPVQEASATTFAPMTIEQFTDASTYIVKGRVISKPRTELGSNGQVYTYTEIEVAETLKGPDSPETLTVRQMGGTFQGATTELPGMTVFSKGEEVFLFLHETPEGHLVTVSMFLGKYTIRRAPGERRDYVRTWHPKNATKAFDHRFLPHPAPEKMVYLDDLQSQVRDRLQNGWDGQHIDGLSLENLERINTPARRLR